MTLQSVTLPGYQPPGRPCFDILRGEPAITGLDGPFTPRPRSSERFARQHRCGPPPGVNRASPYRGLDHPVSGRGPVTIRAITPSPSPHKGLRAVGFPTAPCRICGHLTSPPIHIPRPVFQNGQRDGGPPIKGFFPFPPRLPVAARFQALFTSRHGYFSAFGRPTSALSDSGRI